jgi:hypothetical protein
LRVHRTPLRPLFQGTASREIGSELDLELELDLDMGTMMNDDEMRLLMLPLAGNTMGKEKQMGNGR